jgi:hypothetical protein
MRHDEALLTAARSKEKYRASNLLAALKNRQRRGRTSREARLAWTLAQKQPNHPDERGDDP